MNELIKDYKRYRWFYTSLGKLVVGGKSAEQNDELLNRIKELNKEFIIMHTSTPGSPFAVILSDIKEITKGDIRECAVFTGCFSRAWRSGKKKAEVDIFKASQLHKRAGMKSGTWEVLDKVEKMSVILKLILTKQEEVLRAVPEKSVVKDKDKLLEIAPGNIDKLSLVNEIRDKIGLNLNQDELLSAIPSGKHKIIIK